MDWSLFGRYFLWYGLVAGGVVSAAVLGAASIAGVSLGLVATLLFLGSMVLTAALFGVSDAGIETASSGAVAGFGSANPASFRPESIPGFDRGAAACLCLGLTVYGGVAVAVLLGA
jgi:hypothetical protein